MRRFRLLWQLYPSYLILIAIALVIAGWYSSNLYKFFYNRHLDEVLETRAFLVREIILKEWDTGNSAKIDESCQKLGQQTGTRITVVLSNGEVIGESDQALRRMENHLNRPEIQEALQGRIGRSTRQSPTIETTMKYVAIPLHMQGEIIGIVRTSISTEAISEALYQIYRQLIAGGILVALLAAGVSLFIAQRLSRPLEKLRNLSQAYARGDFRHRLPETHNVEIGGLAEAMDQMANQLDDRIRTILQQRNEREAILSSMVEGVLAIDVDERIISINQAFSDFFHVDSHKVVGHRLQEAVRNIDLQRFVAKTLSSQIPAEGDISIRESKEHLLQAHGTTLLNAEGKRIGAVVVLNDISRLRKLENLRREFVANVSHELKTPITSIKGFVETLLDGATHSPEDVIRFLQIISKQTDRLNSIVMDLLSLSRIEQEAEQAKIELREGRLFDVIATVVEYCEERAREKGILLESECTENCIVPMNPQLLEQAIINLIDNAIKYSESGRRIQINVKGSSDETVIQVKDEGCGIEAEHLPRIFERFYRIDKARSRKMGGTGLGLAIVKHIAQAHAGRVSVSSTPGVGSIFSIHLPTQVHCFHSDITVNHSLNAQDTLIEY